MFKNFKMCQLPYGSRNILKFLRLRIFCWNFLYFLFFMMPPPNRTNYCQTIDLINTNSWDYQHVLKLGKLMIMQSFPFQLAVSAHPVLFFPFVSSFFHAVNYYAFPLACCYDDQEPNLRPCGRQPNATSKELSQWARHT